MCLCIYLHIYTWKLHVCGYIFAYMYTKFTDVFTPSLHVCVHIFTYMYANTHVGVKIYIYTYKYEKTSCVHTECVHANTDIHVCVRILFTGVFYVCVGVYIYTCIHERHHGCIQIHYTGCA